MQREMPWVGTVKKPEMAPAELVQSCRNKLDAIRLCIQLSGLPHYELADQLNTNPGHFSRIMQGQAHFPTNREIDLVHICGNFAPLQWLAHACGFDLVERAKDQRIAELEQELARLKRMAS